MIKISERIPPIAPIERIRKELPHKERASDLPQEPQEPIDRVEISEEAKRALESGEIPKGNG